MKRDQVISVNDYAGVVLSSRRAESICYELSQATYDAYYSNLFHILLDGQIDKYLLNFITTENQATRPPFVFDKTLHVGDSLAHDSTENYYRSITVERPTHVGFSWQGPMKFFCIHRQDGKLPVIYEKHTLSQGQELEAQKDWIVVCPKLNSIRLVGAESNLGQVSLLRRAVRIKADFVTDVYLIKTDAV